jgi:hypothetical protein
MRSKVLDAGTLRGRFHHVPDRLGRDSIAPNLTQPTYSPEDCPTIDVSRRGPLIDGAFRPHWNRNGTDVLSFANEVGDHPVLLTDLEILRSESNQFGPSQAASNEQRQNRPITLACAVEVRRDAILLHDLRSTNGTYLGDSRVFAARLEDMSEFRIGTSLLQVSILSASEERRT